MRKTLETLALVATATAGTIGSAAAQDTGVFTLGELHVIAAPTGQETDPLGGSTVTGKQMETFATDTLDKAVNLAPGVSSSNSGGSRNEQLIYVRGFDRFQVPMTIDGVRIYLPADNRMDFARFLTPDVATVQIAKGYVSVLDGPGGMGGAINLVSYKPVKAWEAEARSQIELGRNGSYEGNLEYGRVGMRRDQGYLQASGTYRNMRGWMLSSFFTPTPVEDGGFRDHSSSEDWSVNLKAGWTPNATDEYSINFIKQSGSKEAPYNVFDPVATQRYWTWPYWDIQNLYWASKTALGDRAYLKTRLYYNTFENGLTSYDNADQTIQSKKKAFRSYYDDYAVGGSAELGIDVTTFDTVKAAFHYRRDDHSEWQDLYGVNPSGGSSGCKANIVCSTEPTQTSIEDTYSAALENTVHVGPSLDLVQGFSYDWRHLSQAEDYASSAYVHYPLEDGDAFNYQGAVIWRYTETAKLFANISARTRFPTLFERFSSRFGGATSNPGLEAERAINYQAGWTDRYAPRSQVSVTAFYSDVTNMIQSVPIVYQGEATTQFQNVGDGYFYGVESSIDHAVNDVLMVGGNITFIHREITDPSIAGYKPSGVPDVKGLVYATWTVFDGFELTPSLEFASDRWTVTTDGSEYYKTGSYLLGGIRAEYRVDKFTTAAVGVRNLFDQNYYLTDGSPEAGRSVYASLKATF